MSSTPDSTVLTVCANTTAVVSTESSSPDAFLYIVVVLSFYALAMTVLMIKYIRRENQEAQLSYYFHEFINRDKFHTPQYRNKEGVTAIKQTLSKFYRSMRLGDPEKDVPMEGVVVEERQAKEPCLQLCMDDSGVGGEDDLRLDNGLLLIGETKELDTESTADLSTTDTGFYEELSQTGHHVQQVNAESNDKLFTGTLACTGNMDSNSVQPNPCNLPRLKLKESAV